MQNSGESFSRLSNPKFKDAIKAGVESVVLVGGLQATVVALGPPKVATVATSTGGKLLFGSTAIGLGTYEFLSKTVFKANNDIGSPPVRVPNVKGPLSCFESNDLILFFDKFS
jgi:hypothetical protein